MTDKPDNPFKLWEELKRRKVIRVTVGYLAAAYVFLEFTSIIAEPFSLPEWTLRFVFIVLCIGLIVTMILSWIYDFTPEGIKKTESTSTVQGESQADPVKRKLKISDGIIAMLVVVVCVLLYPKIFKRDKFADIRASDGRISVAVMPFQNLSGDTLIDIWQDGIQNLLITSLSNSEELSVRQYETMHGIVGSKKMVNYSSITPSFASDIALKLEANTLVLGNIHKSGNAIRITANLMDSKNEEIYKSYTVDGISENDFFSISDSLSGLIKDYLEMKKLDRSMFFDLKNVVTKSPQAYKFYIQGYSYHGILDYTSAIELYTKALEIDSNFVSPMIKLSYAYGDIGQSKLSKKWADKAFSMIDNVPYDVQLCIKEIKAATDKRPLDQINYMKQYLTINPYCMNKFYAIGWASFNTEQWETAIDALERNVDLYERFDQKPWIWTYILLGKAYHQVGDHKKEKKIYEVGVELWPNAKLRIIHLEAICALSLGDTIGANGYLNEFRAIGEQNSWSEADILYWLGSAYDQVGDFKQAEKIYRDALAINSRYFSVMNDLAYLLISNDINITEGMELAGRTIEGDPENGRYLYTYGLGLYKQNKLEEAQNAINRAWYLIPYYDHDLFLHIHEVEQALANQKGKQ